MPTRGCSGLLAVLPHPLAKTERDLPEIDTSDQKMPHRIESCHLLAVSVASDQITENRLSNRLKVRWRDRPRCDASRRTAFRRPGGKSSLE